MLPKGYYAIIPKRPGRGPIRIEVKDMLLAKRKLSPELYSLLRKYNIKACYLFGSQREEGERFFDGKKVSTQQGSDLDVGIVMGEGCYPKKAIFDELYLALTLYFEPFEIDLVFLNEKDPLFQYEAIKGFLLYEADPRFTEEYEEMVLKRASDIALKWNQFEQDFLEAIRDGYFEIEL